MGLHPQKNLETDDYGPAPPGNPALAWADGAHLYERKYYYGADQN